MGASDALAMWLLWRAESSTGSAEAYPTESGEQRRVSRGLRRAESSTGPAEAYWQGWLAGRAGLLQTLPFQHAAGRPVHITQPGSLQKDFLLQNGQ